MRSLAFPSLVWAALLGCVEAGGGGGGGPLYLADTCEGIEYSVFPTDAPTRAPHVFVLTSAPSPDSGNDTDSDTDTPAPPTGCVKKKLEVSSLFDVVTAKTCEKKYGKYILKTVYDLEGCARALGNTTAPVRTVDTDKMPPGCGYVDNPLLGGAVMYLNTRNDSSAYCDPPAVCLCLKLRREVEIGNNFLWMLVGLVGALLVLGIVIWFNYVRLSAYEREKKSHVAKTLAEQIGPGGAACLAALKPFGDAAVSMSWRFGATEADCVEEYHREHNSGGGVGGFLATRKAPDWSRESAEGSGTQQVPLASLADSGCKSRPGETVASLGLQGTDPMDLTVSKATGEYSQLPNTDLDV